MRLRGLLAATAIAVLGGTAGSDFASAQEKPKFYVNFIGGPEIQFFAVVKRGVDAHLR